MHLFRTRVLIPDRLTRLLTMLIMLTVPAYGAGSSSTDDYLRTQYLTHAVGRILLSHQSTLALLGLCAQHYPHLSDSARAATSHLNEANKTLLDRAQQVQQHLVQSIARQQNSFSAERFALEIDVAVDNTVNQFRNKLDNYPRQDRHYVCNRLILSVRAGEWDALVREPEAAQTLIDYEDPADVKIDTSGTQLVE